MYDYEPMYELTYHYYNYKEDKKVIMKIPESLLDLTIDILKAQGGIIIETTKIC